MTFSDADDRDREGDPARDRCAGLLNVGTRRAEPSRHQAHINLGSADLDHGCAANSRRRGHPTRRSSVFSVNTLPRVASSNLRMSLRRTPKPRPPIHAMTSNSPPPPGCGLSGQLGEVLDASPLVAGCPVVVGQLGLDHDLRIEFAGDDGLPARTYGRTSEGGRSKIAS
jgi:hypothetical protein